MDSFGYDSDTDAAISYQDIARKLIQDRFLLTALELHAELVEAGKEVPRLSRFFSNPANFENQTRADLSPCIARSSSQATLDSLDLTRFSEDGERGVDERVAVLEFELRKAKENINALRANLTVATESENVSGGDGLSGGGCSEGQSIKPHEQRALNFLINEYLLLRGYKLTSITFADENEDQDFEDWDDVGLNMCKPAELIHLYKAGMRAGSHSLANTCDANTQTEQLPPQIQPEQILEYKLRIEQLEEENLKLAESLKRCKEIADVARFEKGTQSETVDCCDGATLTTEQYLEPDTGEVALPVVASPASPAKISLVLREPAPPKSFDNLLFAKGFEQKVWQELPELTQLDGLENISADTLVARLSLSLPRIIQGLSQNKKEFLDEIVVLLVCLIHLHPDSGQQESLLNCLFNLRKRPQEDERSLILAGVVKVAQVSSDEVVQGLVLPQCWELMASRYTEKRLLVAQASAYIAPYIASELRDSLLVSMLQQLLLEDHDAAVLEACVTSLAVIASVVTDSDKYSQLEDLTVRGLENSERSVVEKTLSLLLPVVARWALRLGKVDTHLAGTLVGAVARGGRASVVPLRALTSLLPHLVMFAASAPHVLGSVDDRLPPPHSRVSFAELCKGLSNPVAFMTWHDCSIGVMMAAFDSCVACSDTWPQLTWILETLLPSLLDVIDSMEGWQEDIVLAFVKFFSSFSAGFGERITIDWLRPLLLERVDKLESGLLTVNEEFPCAAILAVYCLTILPNYQVEGDEVCKIVEKFLVALSVCGAGLAPLRLTVAQLCRYEHLAPNVVSAIWQGVVHQRGSVRCNAALLLEDTVEACGCGQLTQASVLPALITLASDPDVSVKVSTIPALTLVTKHSNNKEVLDKTYLQIESIVSDAGVWENQPCLLTVITLLGKMAPTCDPVFREDVILGVLWNIVKQLTGENRRPDIAAALVEAYSNTIYSQISQHTIATTVLPSLRHLEEVCSACLITHLETVSAMSKEVESRIETTKPMQRSSSSMSLGTTNVEDMKQRVSKIFNSPRPANLPTLPNLFKKK